MKKVILAAAFTLLAFYPKTALLAHCEIPCGIYDDHMRIAMIEENIATIEKGMRQIVELSAQGEKNYNQIVRWTMNKDQHADELQHIVTQYFMTQRITPASPADGDKYQDYQNKLELLHNMLVSAMKAKQTTDLSHVEKLRALMADFSKAYFGEEHKH
ncbi:MAG TPA: superoxide dismutase [Ni] [archaeon]|nr:superoxide dismutase [Ni] [archaeon]